MFFKSQFITTYQKKERERNWEKRGKRNTTDLYIKKKLANRKRTDASEKREVNAYLIDNYTYDRFVPVNNFVSKIDEFKTFMQKSIGSSIE